MNILIVGGTSTLGVALKIALLEFGNIITAGRSNCDIFFDLENSPDSFMMPPNIDVVIHTAAHFGGNGAEEILRAEKVNALGTLKLCQAAVKANAKHFIFISSIFSTLSASSPFYNIYALSKRHAEELAEFYCSSNKLPLAVLKPSQLYGNGERFKIHQPFLYSIVDKAFRNEDISFYGTHDALRNYLHMDDLTKIITGVIQNKVEGLYSCVHPDDVTYSQIASAAFKAFNSNGAIHFLKNKPDIPDKIFDHDDSLYEKIKYYPALSIYEGMKRVADFMRRNLTNVN